MGGHFDATTDLLTLLGHNGVGDEIKAAIRRPEGARFNRCAFQVNPFEYGAKHSAVANGDCQEFRVRQDG